MQTILPDAIVFVFDRVDIPDMTEYNNNGYNVYSVRSDPDPTIPKYRSGEIYAGHTRNTGITFIENKIPDYDAILFIDGDCIPQPELIDSHRYICSSDIPILSCGKRRESDHGWHDRREKFGRLHSIGIFRRDIIINDLSLLKDGLIVWSCNIAMNRKCITLIKQFNDTYFGKSEVFNSHFNGGWGGEDSFLGIMAHAARVFIHVISRGAVEHIYHPPTPQARADESYRFFRDMTDKFKVKLVANPPPISLYITTHQ